MIKPLSFIADLVAESQHVDRKYGLPAGTACIQVLALAIGFSGRNFRFRRAGEDREVRIPLLVVTDDSAMPGWMVEPWEQVLKFQDEMERQERSIVRARMAPHEHRELRRTRDMFASLGWGFEKPLQEIEQKLARAKLTVNIDLAHEVGRFGGRRTSERPPVGDALVVLANGDRELRSLIGASKRGESLWHSVVDGGLSGCSLHSWCNARSMASLFGAQTGSSVSRVGYLLRAGTETPDELMVFCRAATTILLDLMRAHRISGQTYRLTPLPEYETALEDACSGLFDGLPAGYVHQARHVEIGTDLIWHFASFFLCMLRSQVEDGDDSAFDAISLAAALSRRLVCDHLSFLSEFWPVGPDGPLSPLHRSVMNRLGKSPSTVRDLQRAQKNVQKSRCMEVVHNLMQFGLVEAADGKTYRLAPPPNMGLSEMLSDFVKNHRDFP